jgi:hypothetical protein
VKVLFSVGSFLQPSKSVAPYCKNEPMVNVALYMEYDPTS